MLRVRNLFRFLMVAFAIWALSSGAVVQAMEPIPHIDFVEITQKDQAVDSLNGVAAYYSPGSSDDHWCAEYANRYYNEIYGVNLYFTDSGARITNRTDRHLRKLDADETPKTGDLLFGPGALRGRGYDHWAIVKRYDAYHKQITVIEQHWVYGSCAGVNRLLDYPTDYYYVYRLMDEDGEAAPELASEHRVSEAGLSAAAKASELGIYAAADGFSCGVTIDDFLAMCCNTIRAARGYTTFADSADPIAAGGKLGLIDPSAWQPGDIVTRELGAVIFDRLSSLLGVQPASDASLPARCADTARISGSCSSSVAAVTALGLLNAEPRFRPQASLTLEQALIGVVKLTELVK